MRPAPKPGFLLVARREWRWLLHDRVALILIFGVPLFAFAVLTAVFSQPVIRELGVVVVDADRSETSRALVEQVAASAESRHRRAPRRPRVRGARDPGRGRHCRSLYPGQFRARPQGRAPAAGGRILQSAVPDGRGRGGVGSERQPRRRQRGVRGPRGTKSLPHWRARCRDDRAGQSAEELRAVFAACAVADGRPCGHRACRRLRGRLRVPPAQPAHLARLRGRQSDRRARWQACAPVSRFSSSSCCRRRSFWRDYSGFRSRATCR